MSVVEPQAAELTVALSVVVPAYNEEGRLGPTLDAVRTYLDGRSGSWELVVVDDGSADGTARIAREAAAADPGSGWSAARATAARGTPCGSVWPRRRAYGCWSPTPIWPRPSRSWPG